MLNKVKYFMCLCLWMISINGVSQDLIPQEISMPKIKGYIFPKEADMGITFQDLKGRFTPTKEEVKEVEHLIKKNIDQLNSSFDNQGNGNPNIEKKICRYKRQYFGYTNAVGDKIVWVNFVWAKKVNEKFSKEVVIMMDGGSYFWNVKVDIIQKKVFDLVVNGNS